MEEISETNYSLSLFAGVWFSLASSVPVVFVFWMLIDSDKIESKVLLLAVLPILLAALCGFGLGSSILNPNQVKTSKQAMTQGIKVALFSYALFIPLFSLGMAFYFSIYEASSNRTFVNDFFGGLFAGLFATFIGLILIGWLLILISAIAGLLLFRFRQFRFDKRNA